MSKLHLAKGSEFPPKADGLLRLYSNEYCPYAQRVRLVLKIKNVPHEIVNINLIDKPEWYWDIHPEGKVPTLDTGDKIMFESLEICDYLDEEYPDPALYPTDEDVKSKEKELIEHIQPLIDVYFKCLFNPTAYTPEEWVQEFWPHVMIFEEELAKRLYFGSYFGGETPAMIDYMLWPWGERVGTIAIALGAKLPVPKDELLLLSSWRKSMMEQPICAEMYTGSEKFWKVLQFKIQNLPADYDNL